MLIVLYVLGCFAFMLCMIGGILVAFYSMARGLWSGALIGGIGAIFAMIAMVDCVDGVERAVANATAQIEAQVHD
jgi:hypothetical protein